MFLRIFIIAITAAVIVLETTFLPCEFVNKGNPVQPDAGYHTYPHIDTEMILDVHALACEAGITLLFSGVALTLAQITAKHRIKGVMPRTWRSGPLIPAVRIKRWLGRA